MTLPAINNANHDDYPTRLPQERWLERKDPSVWRQWSPEAPLTRAEMQAFDKSGFLVIENVFSETEIAALQGESAGLRSGGADLSPEDVITEPGSDEVRTVFRLDAQSALFARLARDRRIAGRVSFLLDDDVYLHQSRLNYKVAGKGDVFHTYSAYGRGGDILIGAHNYLDLTPKGRNESTIMDWMRRHDEYETAGQAPACCASSQRPDAA